MDRRELLLGLGSALIAPAMGRAEMLQKFFGASKQIPERWVTIKYGVLYEELIGLAPIKGEGKSFSFDPETKLYIPMG